MTPRQALELFDQVAAKYVGTRQDHVALQEALMVLGAVVDQVDIDSPKPDASAP